MIDIVSVGGDIQLFDSQVPKAANILSVQVESLEYAPDLGIDLAYFLNEEFRFQNESFKAYLIERLAAQGVNVSSVIDTVERVYRKYTFEIKSDDNSSTMVAG